MYKENQSPSVLLFVTFGDYSPPDKPKVSFDLSAQCDLAIDVGANVLRQ